MLIFNGLFNALSKTLETICNSNSFTMSSAQFQFKIDLIIIHIIIHIIVHKRKIITVITVDTGKFYLSVIWFKVTTTTRNFKNIAYLSYKKPDYKRQNQFCFIFCVLYNHLFKQIWFVTKKLPVFSHAYIYATNYQTVSINNCRKIFCLNSNQKMLLTPPVFWMRDTDECSDFQKIFLIYFQYKKGLVSIP